MPTTRRARRQPASTPVRILSVPVVIVLVLGGGWVAGGLITNDFALSMVLTAVWIGVVGLGCLLLFLRRREMWPALATFAIVAAVVGIYLGSETLIDDQVDEDVVTARAPAAARGGGAARGGDDGAAQGGDDRTAPGGGDGAARGGNRAPAAANVLLARGDFASLAHGTEGTAQAIEVRGGRRVLTLTGFETDNGPDLRVYLSAGDASQGSAGEEFQDLGGLKGNVGDQQYEIPRGVDLDRFSTVLIWCRAFSVGFGAAPLRAA